MTDTELFKSEIHTNDHHDWVTVRASRDCGDFIEIEFAGRDPYTFRVGYIDPEDAKALGEALLQAVKTLTETSEG